ncbi:MAG: hypothetical protein ACFFAE_05625 [Candidatus Hodarchaeota archaeon]
MEQSIKTIGIDQKFRIIMFFGLIGLSSLIIGFILGFFLVGFVVSFLCWVTIGVLESSYNQKELENTLVSFSLQNFVITGSAGIIIISILMIFLFLK